MSVFGTFSERIDILLFIYLALAYLIVFSKTDARFELSVLDYTIYDLACINWSSGVI